MMQSNTAATELAITIRLLFTVVAAFVGAAVGVVMDEEDDCDKGLEVNANSEEADTNGEVDEEADTMLRRVVVN